MRQGDAREAWVALRGWQYIQGLKRVRNDLHRRLQLFAGINLLCQFVLILLHPFIYSVFDGEYQTRWRLGGLTVPLLHVPHLKLRTIVGAATLGRGKIPCPKLICLLSCFRPSLEVVHLCGADVCGMWNLYGRPFPAMDNFPPFYYLDLFSY